MKVLHVTQGINPSSGGPTRSVKGICRALDKIGVDVTLFVIRGKHEFDNKGGVKVFYGVCPPVEDFDLVHIQSIWDPALHTVVKKCKSADVPYIVSPRGMLDPWALSVKKWKKRLAMFLYQKRDLKGAAAFHVTAALEEQSVRAQGLKQPVIIAPNGVDLPKVMPTKTSGEMKTAIFLSRLHPGKGLLTLAEAWARIKPRGWRMKVVGPDSYGHKADVIAKLTELGVLDQWEFVDMLNDVEKWSAYRAADLLVHPSVSENFGITIVEGLAAELPVIATKGTPWKDLVDYGCGWWIDQGVEALEVALRDAFNRIERGEGHSMGARGWHLVDTKYSWPAIAEQVKIGYDKILSVENKQRG